MPGETAAKRRFPGDGFFTGIVQPGADVWILRRRRDQALPDKLADPAGVRLVTNDQDATLRGDVVAPALFGIGFEQESPRAVAIAVHGVRSFRTWDTQFCTFRQPFASMQPCIRRTLSLVTMPSTPG